MRITKEGVTAVAKLSTNTMSEDILKRLSFLIVGILAARTGTDSFAAHQISMTLLNLVLAFGNGLQVAVIALVGGSLGSGDTEKAKTYIGKCQTLAILLGLTCSILLFFFAKPYYGLYFTGEDSATLISIGVNISRLLIFIVPVQYTQIIFSGALRASGDIRYTLVSSTVAFGVVNVALDFICVLALGFGIYGIWVGTLISQYSLATSHLIRFLSGKWKSKRI